MREQTIVLDTHIWLWAITGDKSISSTIRQRISLAIQKGRVLIPAICVWEVGMLLNKGRIQLNEPLTRWVSAAFEQSGFLLAPINETVAIESCLLPGNFHNDPADRLIVATTRIEKGTLITHDSRILEYAKAGHVHVLET